MRKKILIVDDNTELLELLCLAVSNAGFTVASASNGVEALAKARSLQPDLLVLDLVLPELDGFAVCEAVRREKALAGMPVILLTGLTGEFTRYAGLECGANEYVKKPVSPAQLVSRIKHWLKLASLGKTGQIAAPIHSLVPETSLSPGRGGMTVRSSAGLQSRRKKGREKKSFSLRK